MKFARVCTFVSFVCSAVWASVPLDLPLNQWPMVETHDAASGYLSSWNPFKQVVNQWTITQPSDKKAAVTTQLNCGARAFDWRPKVRGDSLVMHHGPVTVKKDMGEAIQEIIDWAAEHPRDEDLIVLAVSHCVGDGCMEKSQSLLTDLGLVGLVTDCTELEGMTLGDALDRSQLASGGHILATFECVDENYDPSVGCSGYFTDENRLGCSFTEGMVCYGDDLEDGWRKASTAYECCDFCSAEEQCTHWTLSRKDEGGFGDCFLKSDCSDERYPNGWDTSGAKSTTAHSFGDIYTCYGDSWNKDYPLQRMFDYLDKTSQAGPPSSGRLWAMQGIFQETASSVAIGETRFSSLIKDEAKSKLNKQVVDFVRGDRFPFINLFEVNNVCNGGPELREALLARVMGPGTLWA